MPGSVNGKSGTRSQIIYLEPRNVDESFESMLKVEHKKGKKNTASVSRALELLGLADLPRDVLIPCIFPNHKDERPSMMIYSKDDRFWCFKCSVKNNKYNGIHLLELMGRPELIPTLKAESDAHNISTHYLTPDGNLIVKGKNDDKVLANFLSSEKIELYDNAQGRRIFIDVEDSAIEITDMPSNREIKKRYLQAGKEFIVPGGASAVHEYLTYFIQKATPSEKKVVFNHGINLTNEVARFHFNNETFPKTDMQIVPVMPRLNAKAKLPEVFNIDNFIQSLIDDNNYTHILAFLWGIWTLRS